MDAELLMSIAGGVSFILTIYWVRRRELRERYAIGWITVAAMLLVCGLFPQGIMRVADASRLSYPAAVLFIALAAIYVFSLLVSVSLSYHYRRNVRLTQELAIVENRLRMLEQAFAVEIQSRNYAETTEHELSNRFRSAS